RAAARPAQHLDIGLAEIHQRGGDVALRIEIEHQLAVLEAFLLDDGLEQPALVVEVDIERALGDAGGPRDLAHAGAVKAQIHEHLAGAVDDLPALGGIRFSDQTKRSGVLCNHWFSFREDLAAGNNSEGYSPYSIGVRYRLTEPFGQ